MHTKACIWFVGCLFVYANAFPQQERVTLLDGQGWASSIGPYKDSMLLVAGSTNRGRYPGGHALHFIVDKKLNVVERVQEGTGHSTSFQSYLISGDTIVFFGSSYYFYGGMQHQAMIYKFHDYAFTGFYRFGSTKNEMFLRGALVGNCFYGVGSTTNSEDQGQGVQPSDFFVCKTTRTGELAWSRSFGSPYYDYLTSVVWTPDSSAMLLTGWYERPGQQDTTAATILMCDTNGLVVWQRKFVLQNASKRTVVDAACRAQDEGYYVALQYNQPANWRYQTALGKIDANGDTVFVRRYHNQAFHDSAAINKHWVAAPALHMSVLRNGDVLVAGYRNVWPYHTDRYNAYIARFTPNMEPLWRYEYDSTPNNRFTNAFEDDEGYIYTCGYASEIGGPSNILIAKLDPYGCVLNTCIIPEARKPEQQNAFSIFPNPFDNVLQVSYYSGAFDNFVTLTAYDATGRIVFSTTTIASPDTRTIDTSSWPAGFYVFELNDSGLVDRFKVVKQ